MDQTNKTANWIPWLILLVCLLPSLCANLIYKANLIDPSESKQNGTLISPAIKADSLETKEVAMDLKKKSNKGRVWNIAYVLPKECGSECQNRIHELKNLKIALGREYHRVDITTVAPQVLPDIKLSQNEIYMIDPNKFLMMKYPSNQETSDIYKDIKHVLRYSNG